MSGIDNLFSGMRIASTGLRAERFRMDIISENIANTRTTSTPEGGPYRRQLVAFSPILQETLGDDALSLGVAKPEVVQDFSNEFVQIREPGHPDADAEGMVSYPNVNAAVEMADLVTSMRAYEANLTAQENFVRMAEQALQLLR